MKDHSRKTSQEERIKIVNYCLEHNKNYKETAEKFDISYTQVYQWVKKYLASGEEGLIDRRGQHKTEEQLSEVPDLSAAQNRFPMDGKAAQENFREVLNRVKEHFPKK